MTPSFSFKMRRSQLNSDMERRLKPARDAGLLTGDQLSYQGKTVSDTITTPSSLDTFAERKQQIAQYLIALSKLKIVETNPRLQKSATALQNKLESYAFNLVILGEFKRGKSTLVNALLGANVLPTGVIPLTSITTVILHGESPHISVLYLDGKRDELEISELAKYVTERGNPKNTFGVDLVEVRYPSPLLKESVRIVDTPGTGSVNVHNTETTYSFLPEADAALFVLSADQPASINELKFLSDAKEWVEKFFFVQNKIDILTEDERKETLEFLTRSLTEQLGNIPVVFPISARHALSCKLEKQEDADFQKLEKEIFVFLSNEKGKIFVESVKDKIQRLAIEAKQLLELEIKTTKLPTETLQHGIKVFEECQKNIVDQQNDVEHIVLGETRRLVKSIETDLYPLVEKNIEQIKIAINDEFTAHQNLSKDSLIEALQTKLRNEIAAAFANWRVTEEELVSRQLNEITARFAKVANSIVEEINAVTHKLFEIEFKKSFEVESLSKKSSHYFAVENPFTLSMQMMPLLLPDFLAKNIIKDKFVDAVRDEMRRNAGRLRADMQERIEKSAQLFLREFRNETNECISEISAVMDRAAQTKAKSEVQQSNAQVELMKDLKTVEQILEKLNRND
ncbi:MAG: dynamin family protein [Cyanobacteria bacterium SZAS-4]|nr:dynamin family protein [Cyanobacteria bacterium SZAS-4]